MKLQLFGGNAASGDQERNARKFDAACAFTDSREVNAAMFRDGLRRPNTVVVRTFDAYTKLRVKNERREVIKVEKIGYDNFGLSQRNQAIDHFGDELINCAIKAQTAIPEVSKATGVTKQKQHEIENSINAFCKGTIIAAHSGSQNRKCGYWAFPADKWNEMFRKLVEFGMPGLKIGAMTTSINKILTRLGLLFSTAKPVLDVLGVEPDIRRTAVVADEYFEYKNIRDLVSPEGVVEVAKEVTENRNKFDGAIWHRCKTLQGHPFIVRLLAVVKGCAVYAPDKLAELKAADAHDVWGNPIDWDNVDWVFTESAFKVGLPPKKEKEYDGTWYRSYSEFIDAAERVGARMYCANAFKVKRGAASYQFVQCMHYADDAEQAAFMQHCVDHMEQFMHVETAYKLFGRAERRLAQLYPEVMAHPFWKEEGQKAWETRRKALLGMSCPKAGAWLPITYDWTGKLHGNEFAFIGDSKAISFQQDAMYCCGKSPLPNPSAMMELRCNNDAISDLDVAHNVVIIAANSDYWAATNSDADGDTGFFCDLPCMNSAIHRTMAKLYGENKDGTIKFCPVMFPEGDAEKVRVTGKALKTYQAGHTKTAEIGPSVNSSTWHIAVGDFDRSTLARELFLANDGVNAGKHGKQGTIALDKRESNENPGFRMYTRNALTRDKVQRTTGFCDRMCLKLYRAIPEKWEPEWLNDMSWSWKDLVRDPENFHVVAGLMREAKDTDGSKYGVGLIYDLAFNDVDRADNLDDEIKSAWRLDETAKNRLIVGDWAIAHGVSFEKVFTYWVRRCFEFKLWNGMLAAALRWGLSECFGDDIIAIVEDRAARSIGELVAATEEEDEEFLDF